MFEKRVSGWVGWVTVFFWKLNIAFQRGGWVGAEVACNCKWWAAGKKEKKRMTVGIMGAAYKGGGGRNDPMARTSPLYQ